MDPFPAIKALRRLERRLAGTRLGRDESLVVVDYLVLPNGDKRRICYKDSLKVGVLDGQPCDHNPAKAGIVQPIDVDTVGFVERVDNRSARTGTHQGELLRDNNVLIVNAWRYVDSVTGVGVNHCGFNRSKSRIGV